MQMHGRSDVQSEIEYTIRGRRIEVRRQVVRFIIDLNSSGW
jgi:hypothetical protein